MIAPLRGVNLWEPASHVPDLVASSRGSIGLNSLVALVPRPGHGLVRKMRTTTIVFAKCESVKIKSEFFWNSMGNCAAPRPKPCEIRPSGVGPARHRHGRRYRRSNCSRRRRRPALSLKQSTHRRNHVFDSFAYSTSRPRRGIRAVAAFVAFPVDFCQGCGDFRGGSWAFSRCFGH